MFRFRFVVAALVFAALVLALPEWSSAQAGPFQFSDDNFLCYKGKGAKDEPKLPKDLTANLADQFETADYSVKGPRGICTPADKDGGGIVDPVIHLVPYKIKSTGAKHSRQISIRAFNMIGDFIYDTIKEDRLLVPTTKDPDGNPVVPPLAEDHNVDHYKCYKVKVSKTGPKFPKGIQVTVADQFDGSARVFDIKKPKLLCTPVDKNSEGIKNSDGHAVCYQAKPAKGQAAHSSRVVFAANQFIEHRIETKKEELLCVPSLKNPPDEFCGDLIVNQSGAETCDGDAAVCAVGEICTENCQCTLCGNGVIDVGEACEVDTDCPNPTDFCDGCTCATRPPLGQRTFSLSANSGFFTNFLAGVSIAVPSGTFVLDAGSPDHDGVSAITGVGDTLVTVNLNVGNAATLCYRYSSCTGSIDCDGGSNTDVVHTIDSLAAAEPSCVQDGSNACPNDPSSVCCSNACEGTGVGSGNAASVSPAGAASDSGAGAAIVQCDVQIVQDLPQGTDCTTIDFTGVPIVPHGFSTSASTSEVINHCAGNVAPDAIPTLVQPGENFDCSQWTVEDSPGSFGVAFGAEEPSPFVTGDGANSFLLDD